MRSEVERTLTWNREHPGAAARAEARQNMWVKEGEEIKKWDAWVRGPK
jgi:hypothetical protein